MQRLMRHEEQAAAEKRLLRTEGAPRSLVYALGTLMVCLLASYLFLLRLEHDRLVQQREKTAYIVENYATKMRYVITNAFSSAYLVAALVRQGDGAVKDFDSYAAELVKMHPSTININLAPGGVVSRVFPYERNKRALGHDLFANPARASEARLARESGRATLAGPFPLVQGGHGLALRLPVFLGTGPRPASFWGLICVTFSFPEVLEPVHLELLSRQGYAYQLLRIHPDTKEETILLGEREPLDEAMEYPIALPNTVWLLRVRPEAGWKDWGLRSFFWGVALFMSLLFSCVVGLATDLSSKKKRLEHMSEQDMLTGLPNRRALFRELEAAMTAGRSFAVCFLDLNKFKAINDTYGHDCGDRLLSQFAGRLRAFLPDGGSAVRLGGDEFVVILYGAADPDAARRRCEAMVRQAMERPYNLDGRDIMVRASMGLAFYPSDAASVSELLHKADLDMYGNKRRGAS